jgi:phage terminase small subunit
MQTGYPIGRLNDKQTRFVQHYLVTLNATQAAISAGYSARTARQVGSRLLTHVDIANAIQAGREEMGRRAAITQDEIVARLASIMRSDIRDLYAKDGTLKPLHEMRDSTAAMLESVETTEVVVDGAVTIVRRVKRADRLKAAELLMRHLGMLNDKVKLQGDAENPLAVLIQQVQGTAIKPGRPTAGSPI